MASRTITVTLAGETRKLTQLNVKKSAAWRQSLQVAFADVFAILDDTETLNQVWNSTIGRDSDDTADKSDGDGIEALKAAEKSDGVGALIDLIKPIVPTLLESPLKMLALLTAYDASVSEYEDEIYDDELFAAFIEVVQVAFPLRSAFDGVMSALSNGSNSSDTRSESGSD